MSTTPNGTIVVYRLVGDMPGICWRIAVNKKNKFAYLENCSKRNFGRKVKTLYFAVEMWLSTYLFYRVRGRVIQVYYARA